MLTALEQSAAVTAEPEARKTNDKFSPNRKKQIANDKVLFNAKFLLI